MTRALADTSFWVAVESGRDLARGRVPDELAVSVVTIGELRAGVLAASDVTTRSRRLATLTAAMSLGPIPIDAAVADEWARLRVLLREHGIRMPINGSWIAATAMAVGASVLTQDADFPDIGEFEVIRV